VPCEKVSDHLADRGSSLSTVRSINPHRLCRPTPAPGYAENQNLSHRCFYAIEVLFTAPGRQYYRRRISLARSEGKSTPNWMPAIELSDRPMSEFGFAPCKGRPLPPVGASPTPGNPAPAGKLGAVMEVTKWRSLRLSLVTNWVTRDWAGSQPSERRAIPRKGPCAGSTDNPFGEDGRPWMKLAKRYVQRRCAVVVGRRQYAGKRTNNGKPQGVVRRDQPEAREGQAVAPLVARRFVYPPLNRDTPAREGDLSSRQTHTCEGMELGTLSTPTNVQKLQMGVTRRMRGSLGRDADAVNLPCLASMSWMFKRSHGRNH